MHKQPTHINLSLLGQRLPDAVAVMSGAPAYPTVHGKVAFYRVRGGVLAVADILGLPTGTGPCRQPIFALHIHEGGDCSGTAEDPFADAGTHYNPNRCPHPYHAGDMPPLFGAGGHGFTAFLSDRFTVADILNRTVILHAAPDDFTTQPAGNAGNKIACGVIRPVRRAEPRA